MWCETIPSTFVSKNGLLLHLVKILNHLQNKLKQHMSLSPQGGGLFGSLSFKIDDNM
jgi:hypothetical protein